jgi:GAF domain-containing protein
MRRRSRASGKLANVRSRKEKTPRRRTTLAVRHSSSSAASQETEVVRLTRELNEARELQAATAEVLRVISISPHDIQPVFDTIAENAARICQGQFAFVSRFDDELLRFGACHGLAPEGLEALRRVYPRPAGEDTAGGRAILRRAVVQVADVLGDPAYGVSGLVQAVNYRSILAVPMLRDGDPIGSIAVARAQVGSFPTSQIALLETFARQAVIAIENTRLFEAEQQRTRELAESLERQTATSEVLRVISSSPGDLKPVFEAILENAVRLCGAKFGNLYLREGDGFRIAAIHNAPPAFVELRTREPFIRHVAGTALARATVTKQASQTADVTKDQPSQDDPQRRSFIALTGARTLIAVPMLKDSEIIGAIIIYRQEVRPFTDKQVELLTNFAAQAVIAIENTRLLNELRQRTSDLTESLEQQTATSEVLKVISSSPGDLQPVFETILANATRICEAKFGMLFRVDGENFKFAAEVGTPPEFAEFERQRGPFTPTPGFLMDRCVRTKQVCRIDDYAAEAIPGHAATLGKARSAFVVPMLRDEILIGVFIIYRQEVRPFTDKQIALVENFAAQAVIAIENARLLNELRQSLQQQTATADVLKVISRSTFDLQVVLDTLAESAARLCEAERTAILLREGNFYRIAARYGFSPELEEYLKQHPIPMSRETLTGRVAITGGVVHIPDVLADPEYTYLESQRLGGYRAMLGVPLLREGACVGVMVMNRTTPTPFTTKQIELATTFADQAVIAIENVRLFEAEQQRSQELNESLQQQTATADVLKVISRSTFDLQTVLQTLVESAVKLCDADNGGITRQREGVFYVAETYGFSKEFTDYIRTVPVVPERGTAQGRALLEGKVVHIPDVQADPEYTWAEAQRLGHFRTNLGVPMLREGVPIGTFGLCRSEVRPFTDKQIELVTTFADQAAIAIENVRLFDEIQDKSRQLEEASQHKSQFLANMSHELRTPLNAILGYAELMADGAYGEPSEKMLGILKRLEANGKHLLGLINDVLDLSKIEAGQLVLELSDYCIQDIAQTVRSTLEPLAADKKLGFKVEVAPQLPPGRGDGRRLTQVLINLVGNAIKFTDTGEIAIKADANNGSFYVSVRDTGPGISTADQSRLFQEFQQADNAITRKKGGTGLGLAISKRIIEMHGGRIWVESRPGQGSTFTFTLPVIVERQVEAA